MSPDTASQWITRLIIMGRELAPVDITDRFPLMTHEAWKAGEYVLSHARSYEYGSCVYTLGEQANAQPLANQLRDWYTLLHNHTGVVHSFKQMQYAIFIECWIMSQAIEGVDLTADLLQQLATLGIDVEIRFHPANEHDE